LARLPTTCWKNKTRKNLLWIESAPERFVMRTQGGIPSVWAWTMIDAENSVILDLQIDYMLPATVLGNIAANILRRQGRKEAQLALMNLKKRLEK